MSHQTSNPTVPHYALPNVSSRLPEYTNAAAEAVRGAFMPNSYCTLAGVRAYRDEDGNKPAMMASVDAPAFKAGSGQTGLFSEFVYESSPYDVLTTMSHMNREHNSALCKSVSQKPFVVQSTTTSMYGRTTVVSDGEGGGGDGGSSVAASARDPFDAVRDDEFRHKWLEEHRSRPFLPAGKEKPLTKPTRALLTDIMTHVYRVLCEDWNEAHPTVLATSEDLIVVYFAKEGIKNEAGIQAYMSVFARRNDVVLSYDLRRVNEGWNVATGDGHLMYTLRPPWVRQRSFLAGAGGLGTTKKSNDSTE